MPARCQILGWACCLIMVVTVPVRAQPPAQNPVPPRPATDKEIENAIASARRYLLTNPSGQDLGRASLVVVALIKSGHTPDDPLIQQTVKAINDRIGKGRYEPVGHHVYEAGVSLMALASADPVKFKDQIQTIASFLIALQGPEGDWDYPTRTVGDTSISQYALLGLWEASRSGIRVPPEVWDRAAAWHIRHQTQGGGFVYHPRGGEPDDAALHSMTVAGSGSLHVCRLHLYPNAALGASNQPSKKRGRKFGVLEDVVLDDPDDPVVAAKVADDRYNPRISLAMIDSSIEKGIQWLTLRFTVDRPTGWPIYYLYGLERFGALADLTHFGEHGWYEEGAAHLVSTQNATGSWAGQSGAQATAAFGLLFLSRATSKMLNRPRRKPAFGGGLLAGGRGLPENLSEAVVEQGRVSTRKLQGNFDEILAELEKPQADHVEAAQQALVDQILRERPEELVGQRERLLELASSPRVEVRRTAMWALGRGNDVRVAPTLIDGLSDRDEDVRTEARNALRILSRRLDELGQQPESPEARAAEIKRWRAWYLTVRPYSERDAVPTKR